MLLIRTKLIIANLIIASLICPRPVWAEYGFLRVLAFAERKASSLRAELNAQEVLAHRNWADLNFTLPQNRFGVDNINPANILLSVLEQELGYRPIVSVIGSMSYAVNADGSLNWDVIKDVDLRIHTPEPLSANRMQDIKTIFFRELNERVVKSIMAKEGISRTKAERKSIIIAPGIDEQDRFVQSINMQHAGIRESVGDKQYRIQLLFCQEEELFTEDVGFSSYSPIDIFLGNTERLNGLMNEVGLGRLIEVSVKLYTQEVERVLEEARDGFDEAKPKLLKRLYMLACMRGQGAEFAWLLEKYSQLSQHFDNDLFQRCFSSAMSTLNRSRSTLTAEMLRSFAAKQGIDPDTIAMPNTPTPNLALSQI